MANLFDKLFNKKVDNAPVAQKPEKPKFAPVPRPKYGFVEQYTIVDPKMVLNGGYEHWQLCENVPVVCEESPKSLCGFSGGVMLPTNVVMGLLMELTKKPAQDIENPKKRTVSIVRLDAKHRIYILPNLESPKHPVFVVENDDDEEKASGWSLYMTPEKNRAIVDVLKIHTR